MPAIETHPLPEDPTLASHAATLNEAGFMATVLDSRWRVVFATDEMRLATGDRFAAPENIGAHVFGPVPVAFRAGTRFQGTSGVERRFFELWGPWVLFDTPGGRDELRREVDPSLQDVVDEIEPAEPPASWHHTSSIGSLRFAGTGVGFDQVLQRIHDRAGVFVGTVWVWKPLAGMSQLTTLAAAADLGHLDRMALVDRPDRRPAAVLMADLEASSPLARRLSTAQYFAFGRRLVRAADQAVIDHGGIVGRHAGDGIVAFFLAETAGSESSATRACIATAHTLRAAITDLTERTGIEDPDVALRFGLHWGATLYVGRITTPGRTEVTALGDEVNETARIEACATGGRILASKPLLERLTTTDAHALGIDPDTITYTPLGDLPTATDKARRDAPAIAVTDLTN